MTGNAFLRYENERGESVELHKFPFLLTDVDGIFGIKVDILTYSQYQQDGKSVANKKVQDRPITLGGRITRDVVKNRIWLLKVFNPKLSGTLTLVRGDFVRRLQCVVEQAPDFNPKRGDIFTLALRAANPYWMAESDTLTEISAWEPLFEWPLDIPEEGIEFGRKTPASIINVYNAGDEPTGMRVVFTATGVVLNPSLVNAVTYEQIKINITMNAGDIVTVVTEFGNKRVELRRGGTGEPENAMKYWAPRSKFLRLEVGDNLFRYEAEGGEEMLLAEVFHAPLYVGV